MSDLDTALEAAPDEAAWAEICRLVEGIPDAVVAKVADRLRAWPDRLRSMPDRWWAQRQVGEHRPWHALATHRQLCQLGEYFFVSVAACPNDLSLLLAGSGATGNSDLGDVMLFRPATTTKTVDSRGDTGAGLMLASQVTAVDAVFSPDGSQVTVGFADFGGEVEGPAVYGDDGGLRYGVDLDGDGSAADEFDDHDMDFIRVGQSGDGRLIAVGSPGARAVAVAEAATGEVLLNVSGAIGPVALDGTGRLLAYARPAGRVAIQDLPSGELLSTCDTGLNTVNALAFSPDARGLVAAGGDLPTACLITLEEGRVTGTSQVTVADPELALDATSPFAGFVARACWADRGPQVFVADDYLAVLFDGSTGAVRWTSTAGQVTASFTPDGNVLVASGPAGVIEAWFLDSLAVS